MTRRLKIIFVIVLISYSIFCISYETFAVVVRKEGAGLVDQFNGSNIGNGNSSIQTAEAETLIKKIIDPILSVVRIVAIGIGIIMITYLGMKYMSAAPSEKASIKNQLITFTVGVIVVVGATTILQIIQKTTTAITG